MRPLLYTLLFVTPLLAGCGSTGGSAGGNAVGNATETPTGTEPNTERTRDETRPTPPTTVTALPIANAYLQVVAQWRGSARASATGALPGAQLAPCGYEPRCVASACSNACGQQPRTPPPHISAPPS